MSLRKRHILISAFSAALLLMVLSIIFVVLSMRAVPAMASETGTADDRLYEDLDRSNRERTEEQLHGDVDIRDTGDSMSGDNEAALERLSEEGLENAKKELETLTDMALNGTGVTGDDSIEVSLWRMVFGVYDSIDSVFAGILIFSIVTCGGLAAIYYRNKQKRKFFLILMVIIITVLFLIEYAFPYRYLSVTSGVPISIDPDFDPAKVLWQYLFGIYYAIKDIYWGALAVSLSLTAILFPLLKDNRPLRKQYVVYCGIIIPGLLSMVRFCLLPLYHMFGA